MLTRNLLDVFGKRRLPFAIRRAKGVRVTDVDGRVYLDCLAGANHTAVVSAKYMSDVA